MSGKTVLDVIDLKTYLFTRRGILKAVDGVSFSLGAGETLGLAGESGCGKSMTCKSIVRLVPRPAARIVGGQILLNGQDLLQKTEQEMRSVRGKRISMILQDPMTSLNPVLTIGHQLSETVRLHQGLRGSSLVDKCREMLSLLGVAASEQRLRDYPHQLSGGMRQRVVGAIALSCDPEVLIADEPTTSLDATVQAQFLRLLKVIQEQTGVAIIFVTHDFGILARMCDRVAVMYAGKVVEVADTRTLFTNPLHPYTVALMRSVPRITEQRAELFCIQGQPPTLDALPAGCPFSPRCPDSAGQCFKTYPPEIALNEHHVVRCWRHSREQSGSRGEQPRETLPDSLGHHA